MTRYIFLFSLNTENVFLFNVRLLFHIFINGIKKQKIPFFFLCHWWEHIDENTFCFDLENTNHGHPRIDIRTYFSPRIVLESKLVNMRFSIFVFLCIFSYFWWSSLDTLKIVSKEKLPQEEVKRKQKVKK